MRGSLEACSNTTRLASGPILAVEAGQQRLFAHSDNPSASGAAALQGPLTLNKDGCPGVAGPFSLYTVVLFPLGTRWLGPDAVWLDHKFVKVGSNVTLGGGVNDNTGELAPVRLQCPNALTVFDTQ